MFQDVLIEDSKANYLLIKNKTKIENFLKNKVSKIWALLFNSWAIYSKLYLL